LRAEVPKCPSQLTQMSWFSGTCHTYQHDSGTIITWPYVNRGCSYFQLPTSNAPHNPHPRFLYCTSSGCSQRK
jgi:hypothetical protein